MSIGKDGVTHMSASCMESSVSLICQKRIWLIALTPITGATCQIFAAVYDDRLTVGFCQHLIDKFEASAHQERGISGRGVDMARKNSTDVTISIYNEWKPEIGQVMNATLGAMLACIREYVFFLTGSFSPTFTDPGTGELVELGPENIDLVSDQELAKLVMRFRWFRKPGVLCWHRQV